MTKITEPLVSVFIPYYNDKTYLGKAIESVLGQTYQNWELVLLNHASTDVSREIARAYKDKRIKHIDLEKNYGAGGGILFEKMYQAASGKYIKPFCADDVMNEKCLEEMVSYMEGNPKVGFAFADVLYIDSNGKDLGDTWFNARPHFSLENQEIDLLRLYKKGISMLPYIGSIIRKKALNDVVFDHSIIMLFDMSLWLQLLLKGEKVSYIKKVLAGYRIHEEQISGVTHGAVIGRRSYFESPVFDDFFARCKDVKIIKELFKEDKYTQFLDDARDIPFIVYHEYFYNYEKQIDCYKLHELLKDDTYRKHLIKKFSYDIDDYRREYSYPRMKKQEVDCQKKSCFREFKRRLFSKSVKSLNILELSLLMVRQLFSMVTLKFLRKKKKKKYSL